MLLNDTGAKHDILTNRFTKSDIDSETEQEKIESISQLKECLIQALTP